VVLAARGARNINGTEEPLEDEGAEKRVQSQARWIYVESAIAALILTALSFLFASVLPEVARSYQGLSLKEAVEFLIKHGYSLLFGWVLVEQMGLPIPAIPLLIAAGALAGSGKIDLALAVSLALVAVAFLSSPIRVFGERRIFSSGMALILCWSLNLYPV
jgi:uncharacterized paraquat-inducible protein A